ncbi:hypothetical protein AMATHDRAFT_163714 [Amanita thiersii Skay4041]|uniref:CCHC-type domain-containing protein n=1 Tax=Amanita thiersii Skay4041 TaxID=703135 RepID=A0A2A9NBE5_9AGAR|nr:hypothetical protein AMATHDRAFT_163714 [Amanita thiersii Skay4041]
MLEQVFAQIQQLLGTVNEMQQIVVQQEQTITQLQAQQSAPPPAVPVTDRGPKMAPPPYYDGSMASCEAFINACRIYIAAKPRDFGNVTAKIMWILSYMQTGMAQQFRDSFLVYMQSPEYQTKFIQTAMGVDPIEILYRNIYQAFRDPNKQAMAILELTTMKQGSKSAEEHVQCFKQAYGCSGYQETAGIHELKRSLNTPLLDKCMSVPKLLTTLNKWYELVIQLDRQWRQAVVEKKQTQRNWQVPANQQNQPQQWRPPTQPVQRDPNAMQVDRNRGAFRCYNCGQTGHMACNCPNPWNQQMCLMNAWNGGTDDDREELWRMVTGGSSTAGVV